MRTVNHISLKASNWILSGLLSLLGFTVISCTEDEYGSPYAEYEVKGKVIDPQGKPIPGIELEYGIVFNRVINQEEYFSAGTKSRTDRNGEYHVFFHSGPEDKIRIIATDVDGPDEGSFQTDSIDIEGIELEGGGKSWYHGKAEIEAPPIQLKEIEKQKE